MGLCLLNLQLLLRTPVAFSTGSRNNAASLSLGRLESDVQAFARSQFWLHRCMQGWWAGFRHVLEGGVVDKPTLADTASRAIRTKLVFLGHGCAVQVARAEFEWLNQIIHFTVFTKIVYT